MTMNSELRMGTHTLKGRDVAEVWFNGKLVCVIYPVAGPGVKVISKFPADVQREDEMATRLMFPKMQELEAN